MKESAMLALEYIKTHAYILNLDEEIFDNWNIHIHVPEGAIPKDGPSAVSYTHLVFIRLFILKFLFIKQKTSIDSSYSQIIRVQRNHTPIYHTMD